MTYFLKNEGKLEESKNVGRLVSDNEVHAVKSCFIPFVLFVFIVFF